MDFVTNDVDDGNIVFDHSSCNDRNVLRVVVTEASTEIALALMYRILCDKIFGDNQLIYLIAYETLEKALFLESIIIELTDFSSDQLDGIICTHEPSIAFKNADIVFCIGLARGYEFMDEENEDTFFEECALAAKFYGEIIEKYAKKDVKVIVLGNVAATIISHYAKSISRKNVTSLSKFNINICAAHIAAQSGCRVDQIKNIIIWGTNNKLTFPDCRYIYFNEDVIINDCLLVWLKIDLPRIMQNMSNRCFYSRSLAYALAEHCKILWNGTNKNNWTCMGVYSDNSYGVNEGIFFSFPVFCNNKEYEIVQGLLDDNSYVQRQIEKLSEILTSKIRDALQICKTK
ncbi:PREDICTED: malate dehydrogenase, cytoplasmic-like [Polistes dominula]|uniref:Malate dehydrogenase, cytoplasmic-like n=1 Tax=Polistes dominula TaxID=743375 RepID=A0ABM1IF14_POLDO|nr:PREDICTED: malate dehydrogenase, cytoplasmic-like [Polistes dominula]